MLRADWGETGLRHSMDVEMSQRLLLLLLLLISLVLSSGLDSWLSWQKHRRRAELGGLGRSIEGADIIGATLAP